MMKYCMNCLFKVPLLAGRCPYCRSENMGVMGRMIILLLVIVALVYGASKYENKNSTSYSISKDVPNAIEPRKSYEISKH